MFDSVFSTLTQVPFEDDKPLIPVTTITDALDRIEAASVERQVEILEQQTESLLIRATPFLAANDLTGIYGLSWTAGQELQAPIFSTWGFGWELGSNHALEEMKAAIPKALKDQARSLFSVPDEILRAIAALLLTETGQTLINSGAEQAILQRSIVLAGNFASDILNQLKAALIAAVVPQADTGYPISRKELLDRISKTLNVGRVRAEAIARTELTTAYNSSRLDTMSRSSLVTHVRFLAISDARTTDICRSRNGMLIPIDDEGAIALNRPSLHVKCRSTLSPVMPRVNPLHKKWLDDPARDIQNRELAPLPKGWRV